MTCGQKGERPVGVPAARGMGVMEVQIIRGTRRRQGRARRQAEPRIQRQSAVPLGLWL